MKFRQAVASCNRYREVVFINLNAMPLQLQLYTAVAVHLQRSCSDFNSKSSMDYQKYVYKIN